MCEYEGTCKWSAFYFRLVLKTSCIVNAPRPTWTHPVSNFLLYTTHLQLISCLQYEHLSELLDVLCRLLQSTKIEKTVLSAYVRRETGHTQKHPTRTTPHTTQWMCSQYEGMCANNHTGLTRVSCWMCSAACFSPETKKRNSAQCLVHCLRVRQCYVLGLCFFVSVNVSMKVHANDHALTVYFLSRSIRVSCWMCSAACFSPETKTTVWRGYGLRENPLTSKGLTWKHGNSAQHRCSEHTYISG